MVKKMIKRIIMKCCRIFCKGFLKLYSLFIKQDEKQILIYPNLVSYSQFVDIKNYTHECVLVLFNYILEQEKKQRSGYNYVLVYYQDYQKNIPILEDYKGQPLYRQIFYPVEHKHSFLYVKKLLQYYKEYFKSHVIISGTPFNRETLKRRNQIEFSLSYYVSFKNDYLIRPKKQSKINYVFSPSNICSQIDSLASNVPYDRYVPFGLPKWESLLKPRYTKEHVFSYFDYLNKDSKIIVYTPTHRDYEQIEDTHRGFLGENRDYDDLNKLLQENNTFLFCKFHVGQNQSVIKNIKDYSNIKFFNPTHEYNLYDILPYTDLLISDYTSTYFDYLVLNRPSLFYWFDYEKYIGSRGLSWDPIDIVCEGNVAYTYEELVENIQLFISGKYPIDYIKMDMIKKLVLGNNDDLNICSRIFNFIKMHS